jgi:hypothetical protein
MMASSGASSSRRSKTDFVSTKWAKAFFITVLLQAVICVTFESYVFGKFQTSLGTYRRGGDKSLDSQYATIPTFLALFIFGFLYVLLLAWDALRQKNTIQIIGLCVANVALFVYTILQIDQINSSIDRLLDAGAFTVSADTDIWSSTKPFLVSTPAIIGVVTIAMSFIAYKLYQEFAWDILKQIGADYRMKKRFLHYQVSDSVPGRPLVLTGLDRFTLPF